ncbi:MAG: OsmC family protein [Candidatus Cloacimonetes bacterium]|jgi:osmotically inducible protein OsmC|nr:OsmC family protein [Candidatus Cloacimonadota bacterium]
MKRKGQAVWRGGGKDGSGTLTTPSGVLNDTPYSTKLRFENEDGRAGTNPEELIAAAHAGCYSMALAFQLAGAGVTPEELDTTAEVDLQQDGGGWTIKAVHLTLRARVPGIDKAKFEELANAAKEGCPVSKVLNATITLDATLA